MRHNIPADGFGELNLRSLYTLIEHTIANDCSSAGLRLV
jgi:hypothetical protein